MTIRDSEFYVNMNGWLALQVVELMPEDYEQWQHKAVWQWLYDNYYDYVFQGKYGRAMKAMLENGDLLVR